MNATATTAGASAKALEDIGLHLACQGLVYELFHALLGQEPTPESVEQAAGEAARTALLFACVGFDEDALNAGGFAAAQEKASFEAFAESAEAALSAGEEGIGRLRGEYMTYLAGPLKGDAQPWESVYTSHRQLMFQEQTLEVREFYRAFGCQAHEFKRVADDHVSLECGFMAVLARRAARALEAGDAEAALKCLQGQERFLREHLLVWLPQFAQAIAERPGDSLYQRAVVALDAFCRLDAQALVRDLEVVESMVKQTAA